MSLSFMTEVEVLDYPASGPDQVGNGVILSLPPGSQAKLKQADSLVNRTVNYPFLSKFYRPLRAGRTLHSAKAIKVQAFTNYA